MTSKAENKVIVRLSSIILAVFFVSYRLIKSNKYLRYVFKGGRGGGKSVFVATCIIKLMMQYPVSALVVRKIGETLRESVFEELKEAASILRVEDKWEYPTGKSSKLYMRYKPRGNEIIFRGADKAEKMKSIKISKFPIAILWIEELADFHLEQDVRTIENSVLRAKLPKGLFYILFYTYNPPKKKQSWVNQKYETQLVSKNTHVHHSTYLDNEHISEAFIEEAEETKARNEATYRWEYLGEPIGSGVVPFNNLVFRTIPDEEYNTFDNIRQGIDWGYAVDPVAMPRWHYDKKRRTIYAMDEVGGVKMSNRELARQAREKGYMNYLTTSDVSPRDINEMKKEHGWPNNKLKQAIKGAGSVEYGENWLDDLEAIVIDPKRTPNIAREFEAADYETDKDGNPMARLKDVNNHYIDATRYAFENDMVRRKRENSGHVRVTTGWY